MIKECFYWYWGNSSTLPNTCLHPKHNRQLCEGKCGDYQDTHKVVTKNLKGLLKEVRDEKRD